ncbi:MAG TPA: Crp/Fnr family transcriptional regulator [Pseudorhodoplanes sp.]|nr:Crp/Fnr family transcriptional regulator [Pseudorhodoplanes sp.]
MSTRPQDNQTKSGALDRKAILQGHPLFSGLSADIIERLCAYAKMKEIKRGATIFTKGEPGQSMFAVCGGTVKISVPSAEGKDAVFNFIDEGGIFGEIALLDGRPRTADAIAITKCQLMMIDRRDFLPLLRSHPELAARIIEVLCTRLRHTSEQVEDIVFLDLPGRLAKALLHLAGSRDTSAKNQKRSQKIAITQREIGQVIGMSRESTNKQLRDWQRRKWIKVERGGIVILQHAALNALVTPVRQPDKD